MTTLRDLLRLFRVFLRIGTLNEMAYRLNFVVQTFETLVGLFMTMSAVYLVFRQTDDLGGWNVWQLLVLVGVYYLVLGIIRMVIAPSFEMMMQDVRTGELDFTLLKPVDSQLLVSIREVQIWRLGEIVLGTTIVSIGLAQIAERVTATQVLLFVLNLIAGFAIVYSFWLLLATLSFWFIRIENVMNVFWSIYLAGRWPIGIYPRWLRITLIAFVPVAFAVTVPAETVTGRLEPRMFTATLALAAVFLVASRLFWRLGIRHYSGASA